MKPVFIALALFLSVLAENSPASPITPSEASSILNYGKAVLLEQLGADTAALPPLIAARTQRACFVTFFINRKVVACFGSFMPRTGSLAEEIRANIRMALKNDSRAAGLTTGTARLCDLQITFPSHPERISDWRSISPLFEGLFVEQSDGAGVAIVPGEARTAEYAWRSALRRLGQNENSSSIRLYRFRGEIISTREKQ